MASNISPSAGSQHFGLASCLLSGWLASSVYRRYAIPLQVLAYRSMTYRIGNLGDAKHFLRAGIHKFLLLFICKRVHQHFIYSNLRNARECHRGYWDPLRMILPNSLPCYCSQLYLLSWSQHQDLDRLQHVVCFPCIDGVCIGHILFQQLFSIFF
jgi:hypothetical protein